MDSQLDMYLESWQNGVNAGLLVTLKDACTALCHGFPIQPILQETAETLLQLSAQNSPRHSAFTSVHNSPCSSALNSPRKARDIKECNKEFI